MSRDWPLYVDDLIESAEKIRRFLQGRTFETFSADEIFFDAVVLFNLEGIGKTVKHLPEQAKAAAPEVDWSGPVRTPDVLAHRYFAVLVGDEPQQAAGGAPARGWGPRGGNDSGRDGA